MSRNNDIKPFVSTPERLTMREEITQELEHGIRQILHEIPPGQIWEWDDRFDVPLIAFPREVEGEIDSMVKRYFPYQWGYQAIKTAPPVIRKLLDKTFGMQPDQRVLAADITKEVFLLGLWWPWNDNMNISLRITLTGKQIVRFDLEKVGESLRRWFNL
ncbi:MAG: hypothetical protein ACMUIA_02850 [bacterium]